MGRQQTVDVCCHGLVLQYNGANQTTSITNQSLINPGNPSQGYEPVSLTWSGAGQGERVAEQWTHNGTSSTNSYRYGPLGLSGFTGYNDSNPTSNPLVTSWIIRDPSIHIARSLPLDAPT